MIIQKSQNMVTGGTSTDFNRYSEWCHCIQLSTRRKLPIYSVHVLITAIGNLIRKIQQVQLALNAPYKQNPTSPLCLTAIWLSSTKVFMVVFCGRLLDNIKFGFVTHIGNLVVWDIENVNFHCLPKSRSSQSTGPFDNIIGCILDEVLCPS